MPASKEQSEEEEEDESFTKVRKEGLFQNSVIRRLIEEPGLSFEEIESALEGEDVFRLGFESLAGKETLLIPGMN